MTLARLHARTSDGAAAHDSGVSAGTVTLRAFAPAAEALIAQATTTTRDDGSREWWGAAAGIARLLHAIGWP